MGGKQSTWWSCQPPKNRKKASLFSILLLKKRAFSSGLLYLELLKECLTLITVGLLCPLMKPKWFKCPLSAQLSRGGGGGEGGRGQLLQTVGCLWRNWKTTLWLKTNLGEDRWGKDNVCSFTRTRGRFLFEFKCDSGCSRFFFCLFICLFGFCFYKNNR